MTAASIVTVHVVTLTAAPAPAEPDEARSVGRGRRGKRHHAVRLKAFGAVSAAGPPLPGQAVEETTHGGKLLARALVVQRDRSYWMSDSGGLSRKLREASTAATPSSARTDSRAAESTEPVTVPRASNAW